MEKNENTIISMFRQSPWPGNTLSNFSETPFIVDGVNCACSESFIQSLKVPDVDKQKLFCAFTGQEAWERGSQLTEEVFNTGKIWWLGTPYKLHSPDHFQLVKRGLFAKFTQSALAREALLASGDAKLIHDYGQTIGKKQTLPVDVFCQIVTDLRAEIRSQVNA